MARSWMLFLFFGSFVYCGEGKIPVEFTVKTASPEPSPSKDASETIDFRFAPQRWQTSICLPDDPMKTLVDSEGRLLYEFGGGPRDGFHTRIGARLSGQPKEVRFRQSLADPRIPILTTASEIGGLRLETTAFAEAPPASHETEPPPRLERIDPADGQRGWAAPKIPCDPVFRDVAIGWGRSIEYRFRAETGRVYRVAFGFCEGYHATPGRRVQELRVEDKTVKAIDLVRDAGQNVPLVLLFPARDSDGDGWIQIAVAAAPDAADKNTILNALWIFEDEPPSPEDLVSGKSRKISAAFAAGGGGEERLGPGGRKRADICIVRLGNPADSPKTASFELNLESTRNLAASPDRSLVLRDGKPFVALDPPATAMQEVKGGIVLVYGPSEIPPRGERRIAATVLLGSKAAGRRLEEADGERARAEAYWRGLDLPWGRIAVPDPGVQALLDSSVRNIYQAREIKRGLPAFQVGPTVYRGLWVVDGSFLMEAVSYLGRLAEARAGLEYLLTFQRPDGSIQIIDGHWKETGIALWALSRHAQLTGDREWLLGLWPRIERAVAHLKELRERSRKDPNAPEAGLVPRGFSDGGLGGVNPEYTNVYWNLLGLKAIARAAAWLGKGEARPWEEEYEDFLAAYRKAAERDLGTDDRGNRYVPIVMKGGPPASPQRAQWAFLHAVFPGMIFEREDPLAAGTLAMLTATEREGLIFGTGWIADGIWNYAGSFYAHAHLWMGHGRKAAEILYSFGNHASPLLAWREEQALRGGTNVVGDMPHNWASAEFLRLVRHLLVLERGGELHLLEGLPEAWARRGGNLLLREIATEFGPVTMEMTFAPGGRSARLRLEPPVRTPPEKIVVHLESWNPRPPALRTLGGKVDLGRPDLNWSPGKPLEIDFDGTD